MRILRKLFGRKAERDEPPPEDYDPLVLVPIPALVAILLNRERAKGSPLTEAEVLAITDKATCVALRYSAAAAIADGRGYDDIAPENVWEEWNAIRPSLQDIQ